MKIIVAEDYLSKTLTTEEVAKSAFSATSGNIEEQIALIKKAPRVSMKADSALVKGGKPVFLYDFLGDTALRPYLVVRLSRLGKSIPVRFASRYYDALTVGVDFTARTLQQELAQAGRPADLARSLDATAAIGDFIEAAACQGRQAAIHLNGTPLGTVELDRLRPEVDALVAWLSHYMTLRQGDLLFCCPLAAERTAAIGVHLSGAIGQAEVLGFNIR